MSHLGEGYADGSGLLAIEESRTGFCFRGRRYESADGLTFGEYWTIRGQSWANVVWWWIVVEVEQAQGTAAYFRLDEVRGVAVNVKAHVASVEPDDGVWLRGCIVYEHFCLLDGVSGW